MYDITFLCTIGYKMGVQARTKSNDNPGNRYSYNIAYFFHGIIMPESSSMVLKGYVTLSNYYNIGLLSKANALSSL